MADYKEDLEREKRLVEAVLDDCCRLAVTLQKECAKTGHSYVQGHCQWCGSVASLHAQAPLQPPDNLLPDKGDNS